jgi:EAL domain-containing protein (putative c-di-GMP-specific phosphodiesterase class I)
MDDFGSGYSSLNMLSDIEIDVVKIDRAFISAIESDERKARLVELILGIAKTLGMDVIAEGVETQEQLELLRALGCRYVQGYYFSPPLHPSDFEARYFKGKGR